MSKSNHPYRVHRLEPEVGAGAKVPIWTGVARDAAEAQALAAACDRERAIGLTPRYEVEVIDPAWDDLPSLPTSVASVAEMIELSSAFESRIVLLREEFAFLFQGSKSLSPWFRGQPTAGDALEPTIMRKSAFTEARQSDVASAHEVLVNTEFARGATAYLRSDLDPVRMYFLARHHYLPSRLLDWSASPLVALFFACCEKAESDGAVFLLDVTWPTDLDSQFTWSTLR